MTYWDGTRWIPDDPRPPRPARSGVGRRLLGGSTEAALITLLLFGLIVNTALAAKGGNGGGYPHRTVGTCQVDGNSVSAGGLPTDEVINFMVTDGSGTWGWVLGMTGGDYWSTTVPARTGPTTYEFASRTFGPNGTKYAVFATCSAGI